MTRTLLTATVGLALASLSGCCNTTLPDGVILSCETNVDCPGGYTGRRVTIGILRRAHPRRARHLDRAPSTNMSTARTGLASAR